MEDKVKKIIVKTLKIDKDKLEDNVSLKDDLCIDSLDLMALISNFEDEFNIEIDLNEVSSIDKVDDIINYLEDKTNETR